MIKEGNLLQQETVKTKQQLHNEEQNSVSENNLLRVL